MPIFSSLDHLVIAADTLDVGATWVTELLGAAPQPGGEHPRMGTHNRLLRVGPSTYLEVIAVNPDAPAPSRPRWFQLDAPARPLPALVTWAARCNDIHQAVKKSALSTGTIEPMSRGDLDWKITIPEDGRLALDGVAPSLIQWETPTLPADRLDDRGCTLIELRLEHPKIDQVRALLDQIGFEGPVTLHSSDVPALSAVFSTPKGIVTLR